MFIRDIGKYLPNYVESCHRREKPWESPISQTKHILFQRFSKSVMPENICLKIILCIWAQTFFS
jgi:hypothetical protein